MDIHPLLDEVASAVSALRQRLEQQQLQHLEDALASTQRAVDKLNAYPGGIAGLRQAIDA